jgi:hypothetical protein
MYCRDCTPRQHTEQLSHTMRRDSAANIEDGELNAGNTCTPQGLAWHPPSPTVNGMRGPMLMALSWPDFVTVADLHKAAGAVSFYHSSGPLQGTRTNNRSSPPKLANNMQLRLYI